MVIREGYIFYINLLYPQENTIDYTTSPPHKKNWDSPPVIEISNRNNIPEIEFEF